MAEQAVSQNPLLRAPLMPRLPADHSLDAPPKENPLRRSPIMHRGGVSGGGVSPLASPARYDRAPSPMSDAQARPVKPKAARPLPIRPQALAATLDIPSLSVSNPDEQVDVLNRKSSSGLSTSSSNKAPMARYAYTGDSSQKSWAPTSFGTC